MVNSEMMLDLFKKLVELYSKGGPMENGFIKRPHNTANLNFLSAKLRVRLLFGVL